MSDDGGLLEIADLSVSYGDVPVLTEVDVSVASGESIALLGTNGAGKSTLLKAIVGLLPIVRGTIRWHGRDITALGAPARVRLGICLVPEGKRLFAGMTVRENLLMGAFMRADRAQAQRDLDWVLSLFPALRDKGRRIAGTLSGGEQQMCAIGRGLMARPELLLLDELSFGLAPALAEDLLDAIMEIAKDRISVVLVEQDVIAAMNHVARAYVLAAGRIVRAGRSDTLLADPGIRESFLGI